MSFKQLQARLVNPESSRHEFEFQEICAALEKDFGKLVWTLPHKKGVTEFKLKEAGRIAKRRGILDFKYLYGILKKLP